MQGEIRKVTGGRDIVGVVFDEDAIAQRVAELGQEIAEFYPEGDLLVIGLLKGSFIFVADLVRRIARPLEVDFMIAASYGTGTTSSGNVRLLYDSGTTLEGKHILLVEDIVESGNTLKRVNTLIEARNPQSLETCTLLDKNRSRRQGVQPRFVGFDAPPDFLVGYGLDHAEDFRHLPYIASIEG